MPVIYLLAVLSVVSIGSIGCTGGVSSERSDAGQSGDNHDAAKSTDTASVEGEVQQSDTDTFANEIDLLDWTTLEAQETTGVNLKLASSFRLNELPPDEVGIYRLKKDATGNYIFAAEESTKLSDDNHFNFTVEALTIYVVKYKTLSAMVPALAKGMVLPLVLNQQSAIAMNLFIKMLQTDEGKVLVGEGTPNQKLLEKLSQTIAQSLPTSIAHGDSLEEILSAIVKPTLAKLSDGSITSETVDSVVQAAVEAIVEVATNSETLAKESKTALKEAAQNITSTVTSSTPAPNSMTLIGPARGRLATKQVSLGGLLTSVAHDVQLFSDNLCKLALGPAVAVVGSSQTLNFTVTPGSKTVHIYAKQTRRTDGAASLCSTAKASYDYVDVNLNVGIKTGSLASLPANGSSQTTLIVTALNSEATPVSGLSVTLNLPINGGSLDQVVKTTNSSGIAEFILTSSSTAASYIFKATSNLGLIESSPLTVAFTQTGPAPLAPTSISLVDNTSKGTLSNIQIRVSGLATNEAHTVGIYSDANCETQLALHAVVAATQDIAVTLPSGSMTYVLRSAQIRTSDSSKSACSTVFASYQFVDVQINLSVKSGSSSILQSDGTSTTILRAVAMDSDSNPIANLPLSIEVPGGGGSVGVSTVNTNVSGVSEFTVTSSTNAGVHIFSVKADSGFVVSNSLTLTYEKISTCDAAMRAAVPFANWVEFDSRPVGNSSDPVLICTAAQLNRIADGIDYDGISEGDRMYYTYKLMDHLDLSGISFNMIGEDSQYFQGTFDGNGFSISNLVINRPTANYVGMFAEAQSATLKNLTVKNLSLNGRYEVGLIAIASYSTTITDVFVSVSSIISGRGAGALAGVCYGLNILNTVVEGVDSTSEITSTHPSTSDGGAGGLVGTAYQLNANRVKIEKLKVTSENSNAGGVVGILRESTLSNLFVDVKVSGTNARAGGISGYVSDDGSPSDITRTIVIGEVCSSSCSLAGALVGSGSENIGSGVSNFFNLDTVGQSSTTSYGVTTAQLMKKSTYGNPWAQNAFDFYNTWNLESAGVYPKLQFLHPLASKPLSLSALFDGGTGISGDPWLINSVETYSHMVFYGHQISSGIRDDYFKLNADLDFSGADIASIGDQVLTSRFNGKFDGGNYTLSNITIESPFTSHVGIFAFMEDGGEVKDLKIRNLSLTGATYVGAVGTIFSNGNRNVKLHNLDIEINQYTATGLNSSEPVMGGITAYLTRGEIIGSKVYGLAVDGTSTIATLHTGNSTVIGGLVGMAVGGYIEQSSATKLSLSAPDGYVAGGVGFMSLWYLTLKDVFLNVQSNTDVGIAAGGIAHVNGGASTNARFEQVLIVGPTCNIACGSTDAVVGAPNGNFTAIPVFFDSQATGQTSTQGTGLTTVQLTSDLNANNVVDGLEGSSFSSTFWELDPDNLASYPELKLLIP